MRLEQHISTQMQPKSAWGRGLYEGAFMFGLGPMELILILVIVIVLFGAKRLPAIGEGLAKGIRSFRSNISDKPSETDDKDDSNKHITH